MQSRLHPTALALTTAGLLLAASPAWADTVLSTGFEDFSLGGVAGQNGWVSNSNAAVISDLNAVGGIQHLRLSKDLSNPEDPSSETGATAVRAATGIFPGVSSAIISVNLHIQNVDTENGADHEFAGNATNEGIAAFRMIFGYSGFITVLDGQSLFETETRWDLGDDGTGDYVNLKVEFDGSQTTDAVKYYFNDALLHTSALNGSYIDEVVMKHDNFYVGSIPDDELSDWDNLIITTAVVPTPTAAMGAAFGLLGLATRRRRTSL